ncbi:hypothetical protein V5F53_18645 [Xanthobacter sp. V4C-4]|uniref:cysteine dioxygenase family protein n=1 Tax=Xanthobacter cornucopiae TaxID=3119924 RepID=UPI0037267E16
MSARVPETLRRFIWDIQSMVELADSPREILFIGSDLMRRLVAVDDWLPSAFATPGDGPRLFELYADAMERFCVAASVLAPGQGWPSLQDGIWEISGVLRGEVVREVRGVGAPARRLPAGAVETGSGREPVSVVNGRDDAVAVVIHVHGGDIGRRVRRVAQADGCQSDWVSGYANPPEAPAYDILSIQAEITD